jgi:hypothetical protein
MSIVWTVYTSVSATPPTHLLPLSFTSIEISSAQIRPDYIERAAFWMLQVFSNLISYIDFHFITSGGGKLYLC